MVEEETGENFDFVWWSLAVGFGSFFIILVIITVAGNILVLFAISHCRNLKQGVTNCFVSSLACADFLIGLLVMPPAGALLLRGSWNLGSILCPLWNSFDILCATASIQTLCAIAIDRYVAITSPLRYQVLLTRRRAYMIIVCVWFVSGILSFPSVHFGWWQSDNPTAQACYKDPTCCDFITMMALINKSLYPIHDDPRYPLPNNKQNDGIKGNLHTSTDNNRVIKAMSKSEHRALKALSLIIGIFAICWIPFFVSFPLLAYCQLCVPNYLFIFFTWLAYKRIVFCKTAPSYSNSDNNSTVINNAEGSQYVETDQLSFEETIGNKISNGNPFGGIIEPYHFQPDSSDSDEDGNNGDEKSLIE
uniref:G-protein coupled receptors family 1 profile domain-containing protein n=1 Tax=Eptatretus burgeri TaxID=7764 RepID=A0A8C4QK45_EPTBU